MTPGSLSQNKLAKENLPEGINVAGLPFASERGLSPRPYRASLKRRVVPGGIFSFSAWSCLTRTIQPGCNPVGCTVLVVDVGRRRRRIGVAGRGVRLALIGGRAWRDKLIVLSACNGRRRAYAVAPQAVVLSAYIQHSTRVCFPNGASAAALQSPWRSRVTPFALESLR